MNLHLPLSVWALSISAFFLNCASVIVFGCSPILMIEVFGLRDVDAGILEGTVEGFALAIRAITGVLSDFLGKRKSFLLWGYSITAFSRFLLAPSMAIESVVLSRFMEKLGNGLQASPREAFIGDVTPPSLVGRGYGLNKTFSMSGSFVGSGIMLFIFLREKNFNVRFLLWGTAFLTLFSVFVLFFGVKEQTILQKSPKPPRRFSWKTQWNAIVTDIHEFSWGFWKALGVICLFKLGYFSGTFLVCLLRNSDASFFGVSLHNQFGLASAVFLLVQNLACALFAYPLGKFSDQMDRRFVVGLGLVFMMISLLCFGLGASPYALYMGIVFYGLQMSMQGALLALLSSTMPPHLRGTGFGLFFLASGISIILANQVFMRNFVDWFGLSISFLIIFVFVCVALFCLPFVPRPSNAVRS
jgi:MFS family permease